jgi:GTP:adenosylcobinamide-phosphate guanylyltransferase
MWPKETRAEVYDGNRGPRRQGDAPDQSILLMKAVITAGGRIEGTFAELTGTGVKALVGIRGTTMLQRTIDSLRAAGVRRLAVVGGAEVRAVCGTLVERFVDESPSGSENIVRALGAWPEDDMPLLYATSDLPYVNPDAVGDFVRRVAPGALAVALADFARFAMRFPDAPPFGITLARERIVNGGLFSIPRGSSEKLAAIARDFFEARKRPWRMASVIGPLTLIRFFFGRLSIADLETMATDALGVPASAIRNCAPELAFDVDSLVDYRYACAQP